MSWNLDVERIIISLFSHHGKHIELKRDCINIDGHFCLEVFGRLCGKLLRIIDYWITSKLYHIFWVLWQPLLDIERHTNQKKCPWPSVLRPRISRPKHNDDPLWLEERPQICTSLYGAIKHEYHKFNFLKNWSNSCSQLRHLHVCRPRSTIVLTRPRFIHIRVSSTQACPNLVTYLNRVLILWVVCYKA
jgi:hypothetical protein